MAEQLDPIAVAQQLIAIDSINPDILPGSAGESAIADWCATWLEQRGFEVQRIEETSGRPSIIATARGTGGGRSLLLNGHLDTVAVETYEGNPFSGELREGKLFGRGAFDMKGGIAAILVAAARVADGAAGCRHRGDIILTLVADEEYASIGTEQVLRHVTADAAIITEPSNLALTVAHRGFAWFEVEFTGLAAHGSMPHEGVDAIAHAGLFLRALDELRARLESVPRHPLLGHSAVRVSMIKGGVDAATVAPGCLLTIERRMLPGETPDAVEAELRAILSELAEATPNLQARLTRIVARGAFEADPEWPIVQTLAAHAHRVLGRPAERRGEPFWTDAGLVLEAGIPCLLLGVDGGGAHADTEWASTESIEQLTAILEGTIAEFCA
ncbi:MAG: ArgE/DapE family deacylase [Cryobacterium sp.]|nr:ArgE/DapE family deacylase [Cryobacterium sp.]